MSVLDSLITGPDIRVHANDGAGIVVRPVIVVRDRYPDWSPDGKRIVVDSARTGAQEISVLDMDAPTPKTFTRLGRRSATPEFSPDGGWIAFASSG